MHATDWFKTILRAAGAEEPDDRIIDGVNQLDWLTGDAEESRRDGYVYWTELQTCVGLPDAHARRTVEARDTANHEPHDRPPRTRADLVATRSHLGRNAREQAHGGFRDQRCITNHRSRSVHLSITSPTQRGDKRELRSERLSRRVQRGILTGVGS